jgi:hypothetical protein
MSSFSEIKLTVGGAIDVPEQVWALKAQLQRDLHSNKVHWTIEIVAVDEDSARRAMGDLRRAIANDLLEGT